MREAAAELQGWYYRNNTGEAVRVRLSVEGGLVSLYTFSDRLVASWSLDQLENRDITVLGERWSIGDRRLHEAYVVLESDEDHAAIRKISPGLRPLRARFWRQLGFAAHRVGQLDRLARVAPDRRGGRHHLAVAELAPFTTASQHIQMELYF